MNFPDIWNLIKQRMKEGRVGIVQDRRGRFLALTEVKTDTAPTPPTLLNAGDGADNATTPKDNA